MSSVSVRDLGSHVELVMRAQVMRRPVKPCFAAVSNPLLNVGGHFSDFDEYFESSRVDHGNGELKVHSASDR